jgi:hypothetical protein
VAVIDSGPIVCSALSEIYAATALGRYDTAMQIDHTMGNPANGGRWLNKAGVYVRDIRPVEPWTRHLETVPMGTATREVLTRAAGYLDRGSGRGRFSVTTGLGVGRTAATKHLNVAAELGLIRVVRRFMNATAVWQVTVPVGVPTIPGEWHVARSEDNPDGYWHPAGWREPGDLPEDFHPITGERLIIRHADAELVAAASVYTARGIDDPWTAEPVSDVSVPPF